MSIGLRAVGIGMILAVLGGLLLGWRHQRTPSPGASTRAESGVEEGI